MLDIRTVRCSRLLDLATCGAYKYLFMNFLASLTGFHSGRFLWLLNCTKIIPSIYDLYLLNIYGFCVFPETKQLNFDFTKRRILIPTYIKSYSLTLTR